VKSYCPYCGMVEKIVKAVRGGDDVAIVHSHPDSSPPSSADINSLVSTGARRGVIACHDGSVYVFEVVREPAPGYTASDETIETMIGLRLNNGEADVLRAYRDNLGVYVEHLR
jgi:proteasome lid subunit RPN8/RPN11